MPKGLRAWRPEQTHRLVKLWPDPTKTIAAIARELGVDRSTGISHLPVGRPAVATRGLTDSEHSESPGRQQSDLAATLSTAPTYHNVAGPGRLCANCCAISY